MQRLMRMILPFRLAISRIDSTVKLNQNKTADQRAGVVAGITANPIGMGAAGLAALMR